MRKLSLVIIFGVAGFAAFAQETVIKKSPVLTLSIGAIDFKTAQAIRGSSLSTVFKNDQWAKFSQMDPALGINFINGISQYLDYSINSYFASVNYPYRDKGTSAGGDAFLIETDASIHLKLLNDAHIVVPYLSAGAGFSTYKKKWDAIAPVGAGIQVKIGQSVWINSNFQYRLPITQRANYHFLYSLGFGADLGKKKAEPIVKALPPPPPPPPAVIPDTDGDGINDQLDKCPTVAGLSKYNGCPIPDTDGDGINDENDKCVTVPGVARYNGCPIPDTDGDGINDDNDKCPTVPGLAKYSGCPIPDTDGDGVNDEEDKCPNLAGIPENKGCPNLNLYYKRDENTLSASDKTQLDKVVTFLKDNPDLKLNIAGHTSTLGPTDYNQKLSETRAKNVVNYLASKGIDKTRLTWEAFGEQYPIGDNSKEEGRAQSRRVEIKVKD